MLKIFVASFNRSSDGAISKLVEKMKKEGFYTDDYNKADYILAVGDRKEVFDFTLERYRENKKIIHLWAGEISQGTHDEVYRHAITLMSLVQLCTNENAKQRVKSLCMTVNKKYVTFVIGNVMLDNLEVDESDIPKESYDLVLYNPPTNLSIGALHKDLYNITNMLRDNYIWVEPNGDSGSEIIQTFVNQDNLPREKFLGLLKNCDRFITNSSSQYYEAPFLIDKEKIISIGERNKDRESKYADMTIKDASDRIIKTFKLLDGQCIL